MTLLLEAVLVLGGIAAAVGAGYILGARVRLKTDVIVLTQKMRLWMVIAVGAVITLASASALLVAPLEAAIGIAIGAGIVGLGWRLLNRFDRSN